MSDTKVVGVPEKPISRPAWLATIHVRGSKAIVTQGFLWRPNLVVSVAHHRIQPEFDQIPSYHVVSVNGKSYDILDAVAHPLFDCDPRYDVCVITLSADVPGKSTLSVTTVPKAGKALVWRETDPPGGLGEIHLTTLTFDDGVLEASIPGKGSVADSDSGGPWIDAKGGVFGVTSQGNDRMARSPILNELHLDQYSLWEKAPKTCPGFF